MIIKVIATGSDGNCIWISDGQTSMLLDAGIPFKRIQLSCEYQLGSLSGCLLTHEHQDHSKAIRQLIRRGINIYSSKGTLDACDIANMAFCHAVHSLESFGVGSFEIYPFKVHHDAAEPLGFCIWSNRSQEKILFFTDTGYIDYRFSGLTHILGECNYDPKLVDDNIKSGEFPATHKLRLFRYHMSIETFLEVLRVNDDGKLRHVYPLHTSFRNGDIEDFRMRIHGITNAIVHLGG